MFVLGVIIVIFGTFDTLLIEMVDGIFVDVLISPRSWCIVLPFGEFDASSQHWAQTKGALEIRLPRGRPEIRVLKKETGKGYV